jgi:CubicO group peptidase (beta-lactamase class C family)
MEQTDYAYSEEMLRHAAVGSQPNASLLNVIVALGSDRFNEPIRETVDGRMWYKQFHVDITGMGGVISPAGDAARFVMALLNGGELDGARILSPESVAMMTRAEHLVEVGPGPTWVYKGLRHGLGWWVWPDGQRTRLMHTGAGPGYAAIMQLYPEERLGIVLLGNEFKYGGALPIFAPAVPRDAIAHLAAGLDW